MAGQRDATSNSKQNLTAAYNRVVIGERSNRLSVGEGLQCERRGVFLPVVGDHADGTQVLDLEVLGRVHLVRFCVFLVVLLHIPILRSMVNYQLALAGKLSQLDYLPCRFAAGS